MLQLVDKNGKLYLEDSSPRWDEPVMLYLYYPTGVNTKDYPHLKDSTVTACGDGIFHISSFGIKIALENRGNTKPELTFTHTEPIKKPRKGMYYRAGAWRK